MIIIKVNMRIVILSILIAIFMYPKTFDFIIDNVENTYIAMKINTNRMQNNNNIIASNKTKIVFMFDGGWSSVYSEAYELMKKYGYKASVQVIPSLVDEKEYMNYEQLAELYIQGWNLLNHSYSHKENIYDNSAEALSDFNRARQWMKNRYIGKYGDMVVMPYGEINPYLIRQLKKDGYRNIRTSDNIIILDNDRIEYYPVTTINLLTDITVEDVKDMFAKNFNKDRTVIFILNKMGEVDDGFGMTYSKDNLEQIIRFINERSDEFEVIAYSEMF